MAENLAKNPADTPVQAGLPRTRNVTRVYENGRIRVAWDATRCLHTAICLRSLPEVFDVRASPWIDVDGADAEVIARTVELCPTGALTYAGPALPPEAPQEPTTLEVRQNGPLYVRGRVRIERRGEEPSEEHRVALCRCGSSENKPFCDNSHRLVGFHDPVGPPED